MHNVERERNYGRRSGGEKKDVDENEMQNEHGIFAEMQASIALSFL